MAWFGHQEVDFEDGSDGDMMYGVGGQCGFNGRSAFGVAAHMINFDSTHLAVGLASEF